MNTLKDMLVSAAAFSAAAAALAAPPMPEPCFSAAQVEKGAPKLEWKAEADGSESTVIAKAVGGADLDGVKLTRRRAGGGGRTEVIYTLTNGTDGMRYSFLGWRAAFTATSSGDRNWFPTTANVLDLSAEPTLWGFYSKPGPWHFDLVEPWFAVYNPKAKKGTAFLFDFNTLSAVYGAKDMKTRGVLFDGGLLPPGATFTVKTTVLDVKGLSSLATVNGRFAAGFSPSASGQALQVFAFSDQKLSGEAVHRDVKGTELARAAVTADVTAGTARTVCTLSGRKPGTQSVLSAVLGGVPFEAFRENGFRMAALPLVPAEWTHRRPLPPKTLAAGAALKVTPRGKALLMFGFYANFFRFEEMFPSLAFTKIAAIPQGVVDLPPASTIGEYDMVFLGNVNEESVRPMLSRLAAYVNAGGTLVVGGGPFAFGCGGYAGTDLGRMMPVESRPFDCRSACPADRDGRTSVAVEGMDAKVFWIQRTPPKKGAEVLLRTALGDPLLVRHRHGAGTVYAFLGAPIGDEKRDAKAFWNGNADYLAVMRAKLGGAR